MSYVAEGWRGVVYRKTRNGIVYAEKRAKTAAVHGALAKEALLLEKLTKAQVKCVPAYIASGEGRLESEWRDGEGFDDVWKEASQEQRSKLREHLVSAAYELDMQGVIHGELHRPTSNVRVNVCVDVSQESGSQETAYQLTILDFERGTMGDDSGRNMRAVAQRMLTERLLHVADVKCLGTMTREEIYRFLSNTPMKGEKTIGDIHQASTDAVGEGKQIYILLGSTLGGVLMDLITKYRFFDLHRGEESPRLTPLLNTGSGRSIPIPRTVSALLAICSIIVIIRLFKHRHIPLRAAVLIGAGALGNMYDRVVYHGVRDMFDLHVRPVFNVADIMLTIGVIIYIWRLFFSKQASAHE